MRVDFLLTIRCFPDEDGNARLRFPAEFEAFKRFIVSAEGDELRIPRAPTVLRWLAITESGREPKASALVLRQAPTGELLQSSAPSDPSTAPPEPAV